MTELERLALAARLSIDAQAPAPYEQSDPELWADMRADLTSIKVNDHFSLVEVVRAVLAELRTPSPAAIGAVYEQPEHFDEGADRLAWAFGVVIDHMLAGDR